MELARLQAEQAARAAEGNEATEATEATEEMPVPAETPAPSDAEEA
jgi:hypothetical protein